MREVTVVNRSGLTRTVPASTARLLKKQGWREQVEVTTFGDPEPIYVDGEDAEPPAYFDSFDES
jgi:hypothetical protein